MLNLGPFAQTQTHALLSGITWFSYKTHITLLRIHKPKGACEEIHLQLLQNKQNKAIFPQGPDCAGRWWRGCCKIWFDSVPISSAAQRKQPRAGWVSKLFLLMSVYCPILFSGSQACAKVLRITDISQTIHISNFYQEVEKTLRKMITACFTQAARCIALNLLGKQQPGEGGKQAFHLDLPEATGGGEF